MSEIIRTETMSIIKPGQSLVASGADDFKLELQSLINNGFKEIVIDFSNVEMVDSIGIGVICAAYNSLNKIDGKLKLVNVTTDIYNAFTTMRLDRHFHIESAAVE